MENCLTFRSKINHFFHFLHVLPRKYPSFHGSIGDGSKRAAPCSAPRKAPWCWMTLGCRPAETNMRSSCPQYRSMGGGSPWNHGTMEFIGIPDGIYIYLRKFGTKASASFFQLHGFDFSRWGSPVCCFPTSTHWLFPTK